MDNVDSIITMFHSIADKLKYEKICEFSIEEKEEYNRLLNRLIETNSSNFSTKEKGDALEDIARFVLNSGRIFDIYKDLRTTTNELDQLVKANNAGKLLFSHNLIDSRLNTFIGECKNYQNKISVTYVGKICSLLLTTETKICILFSYHGVTGSDWTYASGLIRKFYLSKENDSERFCIIDFNINDFKDIQDGNNFLQIVHDKILALKIDTEYLDLLVPHENASKILQSLSHE